MPAPKVSDAEFIELWRTLKSAAKVAEALGSAERAVHSRRRSVERRMRVSLISSSPQAKNRPVDNYEQRIRLGIINGTVLVFSDAHFWPGLETTAFRGLLWAIKQLKPAAVINNGDAFDGASISRHPRIAWAQPPSVLEELRACREALQQVEDAASRQCRLIWTLGNHDLRLESRLSNNAPEFAGVAGFRLRDHFPKWTFGWACWPNDEVVVKHRFRGGTHATHNNTVHAGKTIVTGHLHSLKVTPFTDYQGVRWGVDTGTLSDPTGPQFSDYLEQNPVNWRSGFAVLTFCDGRLLWPELVHSWGDGQIEFRGKVVSV